MSLILKKGIDWSVFNYGFNISILKHSYIYSLIEFKLDKGEKKDISIFFNKKRFTIKLCNQKFNQQKYPKHGDILQFRYTADSPLANEIKKVFKTNYEKILSLKLKQENKRKHIILPENIREYIVLYASGQKDSFYMEGITQQDVNETRKILEQVSEEQFESLINREDLKAELLIKNKAVKIRKIDRTICRDLKLFYRFQCQICGMNCSENYAVKIAEAHHIDPFVSSLNNDAKNIMILCPNHHRIVHMAKPSFDNINKIFKFKNGYIEKLKINKHL